MYLYELAIELGERSADLAEAAERLGIGTIGASSELTPEQVATLRQAFAPRTPPPPAGPMGAPAWPAPAPGAPPLPTGAPGAGPAGMPRTQLAVIGVVVVAVIGLFAYMVVGSSDAEDRIDEGAAWADDATDAYQDDRSDDDRRADACKVLGKLRDLDIAAGQPDASVRTVQDQMRWIAGHTERGIPLYDEAVPLIPELEDELLELKRYSADIVGDIRTLPPEDVQQALLDHPRVEDAGKAAIELDRWSQEHCGFSTGNN